MSSGPRTRGRSAAAAQAGVTPLEAGIPGTPTAMERTEPNVPERTEPTSPTLRRSRSQRSRSGTGGGLDDDAVTIEEVEQRVLAVESFSANLGDEVEQLRKELKKQKERIEELERKDRSARETKDPSGTYIKWGWRAISQVGEEFFNLIEKLENSKEFMRFILDGERERNLDEIPPLLARYRAVQNSLVTRQAYRRLCDAVDKKERPESLDDGAHVVLVELAALFLVTMPDGMCPLPVKTWLAIGRTTRERARAYTESSFTEVEVDSVVTDDVRRRLPTYGWAQGFPLPEDYATGEAIKSPAHYKKKMREVREQQIQGRIVTGALLEPALRSWRSEGSAVGSQGGGVTVLSGEHRSVTQTGCTIPYRQDQRMGRPAPNRRPRRNLIGVSGDLFVGDRCMKCGKRGHQQGSCPAPHPSFKPDQPLWVLDELSHGRLPLP